MRTSTCRRCHFRQQPVEEPFVVGMHGRRQHQRATQPTLAFKQHDLMSRLSGDARSFETCGATPDDHDFLVTRAE